MAIAGTEGMSVDQLRADVSRGGKFVMFPYTISLLVITLRRSSAVTYIGAGQSHFRKGLPYALTSLVLGWWGFPWGLIYTPITIFTTLRGGRDVTGEVMAQFGPGPMNLPPLAAAAPVAPMQAAPPQAPPAEEPPAKPWYSK